MYSITVLAASRRGPSEARQRVSRDGSAGASERPDALIRLFNSTFRGAARNIRELMRFLIALGAIMQQRTEETESEKSVRRRRWSRYHYNGHLNLN